MMAKLVVGGKDLGVHPFVVQLRCLDSHASLPGVTAPRQEEEGLGEEEGGQAGGRVSECGGGAGHPGRHRPEAGLQRHR